MAAHVLRSQAPVQLTNIFAYVPQTIRETTVSISILAVATPYVRMVAPVFLIRFILPSANVRSDLLAPTVKSVRKILNL
jgi:hypothetical protein